MNVDAIRKFKTMLARRPVFGPFAKTYDPAIIEALGHAGFDFVILDMEHGPSNFETIQHLIRAAEVVEILSIVRITPGNFEDIPKVLDIGCAGVQVPQITCAQDAELALQAAKFSPRGTRGVCRYVRAADYSSMEKSEYFHKANESLVVIQVEGQAGLDNLESILDIEGIDVVFVGPYDLSQSLGVTGQIEHPLVVEKTRHIVRACLDRDITVGNFTETPKQTAFWIEQGLRYMSFSVDIGIMVEAGKALISALTKSDSNDPSRQAGQQEPRGDV